MKKFFEKIKKIFKRNETSELTEEEKVIKKVKRVNFFKKIILVFVGFIIGLFVGKSSKKDKSIDVTIEDDYVEA